MPFKLVKDTVSHDTVEALEELLNLAKQGELTGIAFACSLRKMRYITNTAGYCFKNPTFTRGMIWSLADELGVMIHTANKSL